MTRASRWLRLDLRDQISLEIVGSLSGPRERWVELESSMAMSVSDSPKFPMFSLILLLRFSKVSRNRS
jgi:hypothetical protein